MRREENQLDVTECFITLMIRSTCFGHFYAHHQELETVCVLLPPMVCSAWLLVVEVRCRAAVCESRKRDAATLFLDSQPAVLYLTSDNQLHPSSWTHSLLPAPDPRQPATKHCTP